MSDASRIDAGKLLGFNAKGEPLFDAVLPELHQVADTRAVGTGKLDGFTKAIALDKAVGNGKALGGSKAQGGSKAVGGSKAGGIAKLA